MAAHTAESSFYAMPFGREGKEKKVVGRMCCFTSTPERTAIGARVDSGEDATMDALAERLDAKLREWKPETAARVRERVTEVIELADHDVLDLMRPRETEQEVLDLLDKPTTR